MRDLFKRIFGKKKEIIIYVDEKPEIDKHAMFVDRLRDNNGNSAYTAYKVEHNEIKIKDLSDNDLESLIDYYKKKLGIA